MKFGKQLEISANPEWRDSYVQYKRLKRLIKRVAFEVEKQTRKQEKLQQQQQQQQQQQYGTSPPKDIAGNTPGSKTGGSPHPEGDDALYLRVDETHPLLRAAIDEVKAAKEDFWEVTGDNLSVVNDFYTGKVVSLQKSIKDFEETLADEHNSRGHVHSRGRTLSQGMSVALRHMPARILAH
jgi:phosphate transporter